jgi:hypothetical protein
MTLWDAQAPFATAGMGSGKAEAKARTKPQLEQMAAVLKQQPALRVLIAGHTDNEGRVDANVALSQQRAHAVAGTLVKDFGIDAKRLGAQGHGELCAGGKQSERGGAGEESAGEDGGAVRLDSLTQ